MAEFKKCPRNSRELFDQWRLASVDEVKSNIEGIKEKGKLDSEGIARLLDGCVKEKYICVKQHISNTEHMILVKTLASRPLDGSYHEQMYSGVKWTSQGGQAAVLLSCEDKITEAICFVLYSIVQNVEDGGKRQKELNKLTESLEEKFRNGRTVLHYAADQPHNQKHGVYVAECLKDHFKDGKDLIKAADQYGRTALHFSAFHGNTELCQFLVQQCEMEVDKTDQNGENLLHFAVKGKKSKVFKSLCELPEVQSIIGSRDAQGKTALHKAAAQGSKEMITTLLSNISKSKDKQTYISQANLLEQSEVYLPEEKKIQLVFIRQPDLIGQTALLEAARGGHVQSVKLLLENGSNPVRERHYDGKTALHYAVKLSDQSKAGEMAKLLLSRCKSDGERSLLLWASATGIGTAEEYLQTKREKQWATVEEYLKTERKRTEQSLEDLLCTAIKLEHERMAWELVNRGADTAHLKKRSWSSQEKLYIDNLLYQLSKMEKIEQEQASKIMKKADFGRDQPTMYDSLGRKEFAEGLAALFLNPCVKSPLTVGITGDWGIGKSSVMIQTEIILLKTAAQLAFPTLLETEQFPECRQIVQSRKGRQKYEEVNKAIKDIFSPSASSDDDPLVQFLNGDYQQKYREVYKSLALTDRNEMFQIRDDDKSANSSTKQYTLRHIPSILTVHYNAWHYQNELEAWAGLAVQVTKALEESMTRAQRVRCRCRYAWTEHGNKIFLELFLPCLLALFLSVWVAWAIWKLLTRSKHKELQDLKYGSIPVTVLVVVWTVVKQLLSVLKPVSAQIIGYLQLHGHRTNLGYQHQVISDIKFLKTEIGKKPCWIWRFIAWLWSLCGLYPDTVKGTSIPRSPPPDKDAIRMIVFVDDLDRCQPKVILQVLSAVNLVLAACNINAVLGLDVKMIASVMKREFPESKAEELAERYISKIVQLPLALPDTSEVETRRFLDEQLGPKFELISPDDAESNAPTERSADQKQSSADHNRDCVRLDVLQNEQLGPALEVTMPDDAEAKAPIKQSADQNNPRQSQSFLAKLSQIFEPLRRFKNCLRGRIRGRKETKGKLRIMKIGMIIPKYSESERDALYYLSNRATGTQRLPREWKRFLTYHRLAWHILSLREQALGWPTQLVLWVFCCWQWKQQIDVVIQNWKKIVNDLCPNSEVTEDSLELIKPSLKNIVGYCYDKIWRPRQPNEEEEESKKEKVEWLSLIETLGKYDVPMESMLSFQKFRLHCGMGYLSISNPPK